MIKLHKYLVSYYANELDLNIFQMHLVARTPKEAKEIAEEVFKLKGKPIYVTKVEGTRQDFLKRRKLSIEDYYKKELDLIYYLRHHIKKGDIL